MKPTHMVSFTTSDLRGYGVGVVSLGGTDAIARAIISFLPLPGASVALVEEIRAGRIVTVTPWPGDGT